ncbi:helix-turn-helix domain-containing protein [Streptomyces arenae]|nr:helix-turn-helix domain-containing protein [Streptomyces arenae]
MISAAKENDLSAITAVIAETEALITRRANDYAKRAGGTVDHDLAEDLAQAGRIRLWESIQRFEGNSAREFMAYIDRALHSAMTEQRHEIKRPGVSAATAKDFERALTLASGDPYAAARIATTDEMGARKMSSGRAHAALLAWLGVDSLDRPAHEERYGSDITLGDVVAAVAEVPADLLDSRDYETTRRAVVREQVHRTLGLLGERHRHVLKAGHGISPVADYSERPDAELAADMGATAKQVKEARSKGAKRFAALYAAGARV